MKKYLSHRCNINLLALFTLLSCTLWSCGGAPEQAYMEMPPLDVDFLELKPATAMLEQSYPGTIEGIVNVEVKAQVSGYLGEIYVNEGDYVQKGQRLFKIKADIYNQQVSTQDAALKAALAAEESAKIELEKVKPLVEGKVVSELQLKTATANHAAAQAQVAQAQAALRSSQINADFSLIKAPVSGYIGRIPNRIGNLVTPADPMPLTTLSEISQVFVYFSLSEAEYLTVMKDQKSDTAGNTVELMMADGTMYGQKGRLEVASGNINRTTGSITMKAVFDNPDKLLRSGGSAKVILNKALPSSLLVPMGSVRDIQNKYFVFALSDSTKVVMKPIEISGHDGNPYILQSGLAAGDKIAINRIDQLNDGVVVNPTAVAADSAAH